MPQHQQVAGTFSQAETAQAQQQPFHLHQQVAGAHFPQGANGQVQTQQGQVVSTQQQADQALRLPLDQQQLHQQQLHQQHQHQQQQQYPNQQQ